MPGVAGRVVGRRGQVAVGIACPPVGRTFEVFAVAGGTVIGIELSPDRHGLGDRHRGLAHRDPHDRPLDLDELLGQLVGLLRRTNKVVTTLWNSILWLVDATDQAVTAIVAYYMLLMLQVVQYKRP